MYRSLIYDIKVISNPAFVLVIFMSLLAHQRINVMTYVHISQDLIKFFFRKQDLFFFFIHTRPWMKYAILCVLLLSSYVTVYISRRAVLLPPRCVNQVHVHARSNFVNMNHYAHTHLDITVILHVEKNRNDNVDWPAG